MLETEVGGVKLGCCIYNSSGPLTHTAELLEKIAASESGAVVSKSATLEKREGNPLPRSISHVNLGDYCMGSINAEGLPNEGIDYYMCAETVNRVTAAGKPYIISLSGLTLNDNLVMIDRVYDAMQGIAAVELNLACPNLPGKPIVSNDFDQMRAVLKAMTSHPKHGALPLGIKLGPYLDRTLLEAAADAIADFPISFVVCCNSLGNALFVDAENECECLAGNRGLGGLGGGFLKHTALANVRVLRQLLDERRRQDIDIVGVGGVHTGRDAFELILCGARAVQVGTCHWNEGVGCFARIASELRELMERKGYRKIDDFRGSLEAHIPGTLSVPPVTPPADSGDKKRGGVGSKKEEDASEGEGDSSGTNVGELALKLCYVFIGAAAASTVGTVRNNLGL